MLLIVYRGEKNKGISMPEERLRHSSEIVQQWQKRFLGRELSSRCVTGDGGQGRGGQREFRQYQRCHAGAWKIPRTQIPLFLTSVSVFSLWLFALPPAFPRRCRRQRAQGARGMRGCAPSALLGRALPASQVCNPKTISAQLGTNKQKSSCVCVPSEQAKC